MAEQQNMDMFGYTPAQGVVEAPVVNINQKSKVAELADSLTNLVVAREKSIQAEVTANEDDRYWNAKNKYNANMKTYYDTVSSTNDVNVHAQALQQLHLGSLTLSDEFQLSPKHRALLDKTVNDFTFSQRTAISGKIDKIETNTRINNAVGMLPNMVGEKPDTITENLSMLRNGISQSGTMEASDINKLLSSGYLNSVQLKFDYRNTSREQIKAMREEAETVLGKFDPTFLSSNEYLAFQNKLNMAEEGIKTDIKREVSAMRDDPKIEYSDLKKKLDSNPDLYSKEEVSNILNRKKVTQVETRVSMAVLDSLVSNNNEQLLSLNKTNPRAVENGLKNVIGSNVDIWKTYTSMGIQVGNVKEIDDTLQAINSPGAIQSIEELSAWKNQYDKAMQNGYPIRGNLHKDVIVMNILYKRNPDTAMSDYQTLKRNPREVTDSDVDKFYRNKVLNAELVSTRWDIDAKSGAMVRDAVRPLVKALMAGGLDKEDIIDDVDDYLDSQFMQVDTAGFTFDKVIIPKTDRFNSADAYDTALQAFGGEMLIPLDVTQPEGKWKVIKRDEKPEIIEYDDLLFSLKKQGRPKKGATIPTTKEEISAKQSDIKDMITNMGTDLGYSTDDLVGIVAIANIESTLGTNPDAYDSNKSYKGLFQIGAPLLSDVNKKYGTSFKPSDMNDDYTATQVFLKYLYPMYKTSYNKLVPANLRKRDQDITPLDTYLIHQQGAGGFRAIMSNLNTPIETFKSQYKDIYDGMMNNYYGTKEIRYVRDFTDSWLKKKDKHFQKALDLIK